MKTVLPRTKRSASSRSSALNWRALRGWTRQSRTTAANATRQPKPPRTRTIPRPPPKGQHAPYFARKYYGEIRNYSRPLPRETILSLVIIIGGVAVSTHRHEREHDHAQHDAVPAERRETVA